MGTFIGDVETRWLVEKPDEKLSFFKRSTSWLFDWDTDRKMLLLSNFTYIDNTGKEWTARKGEIVDGASFLHADDMKEIAESGGYLQNPKEYLTNKNVIIFNGADKKINVIKNELFGVKSAVSTSLVK